MVHASWETGTLEVAVPVPVQVTNCQLCIPPLSALKFRNEDLILVKLQVTWWMW